MSDREYRKYCDRLATVMFRHQLCSEHAAACFLDAKKKDRTKSKAAAEIGRGMK